MVQTSVKFQLKYKIFIHEYAFENIVCEMAAILVAILSRGRWVEPWKVWFIQSSVDPYNFPPHL